MENLHNRYGVLITVYALVMITGFSTEAYDFWDLAITVPAGFFAASYLLRVRPQSFGERSLASLVMAASLVLTFEFAKAYFLGLEKQCLKDCSFNSGLFEVIFIVGIAALLTLVGTWLSKGIAVNE